MKDTQAGASRPEADKLLLVKSKLRNYEQNLTLSISSINSKEFQHSKRGAVVERGGSNRVPKRSPILCVDQTGFKTSREGPNTSRNHLKEFSANMDPQFKLLNLIPNKSHKVIKMNQQIYSPDFDQRYRDSPGDQFSATFNNQVSSVQK